MSRFLSFLVSSLTIGSSMAIRGERRRLQAPLLPPDKAVKCRPLPKSIVDPKNSGVPSMFPTQSPSKLSLPKDTAAPTVTLPYCTEPPALPKAKKAKVDCLALSKGALPKDFDGSVAGYLTVDLSYSAAPIKVLAEVSDVLEQETSATVAGCPNAPVVPMHRQLQNGTAPTIESNLTALTPTILGVNFSDISIGGECTPVNKTLNCSEVTCNVTILYSGVANATEEEAMLALLKATIEAQAAQGSFASAGVVGNVSTGLVGGSTTSQKDTAAGGNPTIIVVGAVAGIAVVVGALFAGYKYKTRPNRDRAFDGEPAWTGVIAVAEVVQDTAEATLKKVTGKAI